MTWSCRCFATQNSCFCISSSLIVM